jgi:hypothetical protein
MRQRLSPWDTIVCVILGTPAADGELPSDRATAVAFGSFEIFGATLSSTRDWSGPELGSISPTATTTFCLDVACFPSGCLDLNVNS